MSIAGTLAPQESGSKARPRMSVFLLLFVAVGACLYLVPRALLAYGAIGVLVVLLLCYLTAMVLRGDAQPLLLGWVLLFPLGYYFLSFPRERPIFTLDRGLVAGLIVAMCFAPPDKATPVPREMRRAALAWLGYVVGVLISFVHLNNFLGPFQLVVDSFILPAVLGWYLVRSFPVRQHLRTLHALICVSAVYVAAIGALEIVWGEDLLPLPGAGQYYAGEGAMLILRPNGPFLASHSFVLIGLMSFIFLRFLRRAVLGDWTIWQKGLHGIGTTSAALIVLMGLHRSGALTLLAILILDSFHLKTHHRRKALLALAVGFAVLVWGFSALLPEIFAERFQDPANLYARIAQQVQTLKVFSTHPLTGVGFANFGSGVQKLRGGSPSFKDVEAVDSPHNNLGAVLAETGLLAFVPFIVSQVLFAAAFWRRRQTGEGDAQLAWQFFLYLFLAYWINGLNISAFYSSDLNLWYLFATTAVYRYGITPVSATTMP